jgi:D-glycero-D-manno-heptose 1,7-bisphosphate phosphatase
VKLLILDHEGVLSSDIDGRTLRPEDWNPIEGAAEALARLTQAGWRLVVLTDRSAITRGACDLAALNLVHRHMITTFAEAGARIDLILFAPPAPSANRRAQLTATLEDLLDRLGIAPDQTTIVSDTGDELQVAHALGCQPVLVLTGLGRQTFAENTLPANTQVRVDLHALAADWVN